MPLNPVGAEWTSGPGLGNLAALSNGTLLRISGSSSRRDGQFLDTDGSPLGAPFLIRELDTPDFSFAGTRAAALSNGRFAIAWTIDTDGLGKTRLETGIFKADGTLETGIAQQGYEFTSGVMTDSLPSGGFALVYYQGGTTERGLKGRVFDSSGALSQAVDIPASSSATSMAALNGGGYVTAAGTLEGGVSAFITGSNGQIVPVSVTGAGSEPLVAGLANGNFVVAWQANTTKSIMARIYSPQGQPVSGELTLHTHTTNDPSSLALRALLDGGFALAFVSNSMRNDLQYQDTYLGTFAADGTVDTAPTLIGRDAVRFEGEPSITVFKDGRYLVRWSDEDNQVFHYQLYDPRTKGVDLTGDGADDRYEGSRFSDRIDGAGGNDRLTGGDGNDILIGGAGNDVLDGGVGDQDKAVFTGRQADYTIVKNSDGSFTVTDNRGNDGQDRINGIEVFQFSDSVQLPGGTTTPVPPVTSPPSSGGSNGPSGLVLRGTARADRLTGREGDDQLWGRAGKDVLAGGAGKDVFVFDTKPGKANLDRIVDFSVADDTIWLDNALFKANPGFYAAIRKGTPAKPLALKSAFFRVADKAKDANDFLVYDRKKGVLFYDPDGAGEKAMVAIATLSKNLKMTVKDFFVI